MLHCTIDGAAIAESRRGVAMRPIVILTVFFSVRPVGPPASEEENDHG